MTRLLAPFALALLLLPAGIARAVDKPNILFVMVDDLGKDGISCYGADDIETPHVDALARTGMKFEAAWSMPQCTPTRTTLLTGRYPFRTGWTNHWDVPRWGVGYFDWEHETTFARLLKSAGYSTAIAGKWQINDFRLEPKALEKHGFDEWCVWTGYEGGNKPSGERYWDAYIATNDGSRRYEGKYGPDLYADFLIDFARRHRDEPMLLYWPMCLTHGPLVTTPHDRDVTKGADKHAAMVRYTDHLVGRVMGQLEELGIRDRTLVIFTTDNGTAGGQLGTIGGKRPSGGKGTKFEGGVCEPFIVSCPGLVPQGVVTDALTDFSDLLPTFVELAGAKLPEGVELDGRSIAPLLLGKTKTSPREWILAMGHGGGRRDERGIRGVDDYADRVLRDERYKIWVGTDRQVSALYDLRNDPLERTNLLEGPELEPAAAASLAKLREVLATLPEVDGRPVYRPRDPNPWDVPIKKQRLRESD